MLAIKVKLSPAREQEWELCFINQEESSKENGSKIRELVEDMKGIRMAISMKGTLLMGKLMVRVSTPGRTENYMMENGIKVSNMAQEFGKESIMTLILESGTNLKHKDTEYTAGKMVIDMRVNGISV